MKKGHKGQRSEVVISMKKIIVLFLFVLFLGSAAIAADKPLGVEEFTSVEELAVSLSTYFPKAQGDVKAVQGDRLTLSLAKKDGIIPGMMLTLWRDGREILHPVTNAVIGRAEDEIGTIEVTSVGEASSTAIMKKKLKDPAVGDRARITPRRINLAVLPIQPDHPEIVRTLVERLNEFGRFNVLDPDKVYAFVRNSKTMGTSTVKELGTAFGLDAVISLGMYPSEGRLMVTARIFYTEDASQLDTIVAMLNLQSKKTSLGEIKPYFVPVKEESTISAELPFVAQSFVSADFEGDGRLEYAFSDGTRVHVYRNEPSGWREVWTEIPAHKPGAVMEWQGQTTVTEEINAIQLINLDAADINGNGRSELFVTAMVNGKVVSWVIEFQDGAYRRSADVPGFLRVVNYPGKGTILLGQAYDPATFYAGQPRQYVWSQGKYTPGEELALPKGLPLYGWTYANVGERQPLLVALDEDDRLVVYSGDMMAWKSADTYPIMDFYVYKPVTGISAALGKQPDKGQRERLRGRVVALDLNGDGKDEILVPKNTTSLLLGGFTGAELYGMGWTGARLDTVWSNKGVPGPVYDFRALPSGQGAGIAALVRTKGGLFTKDQQQVMTFTIK